MKKRSRKALVSALLAAGTTAATSMVHAESLQVGGLTFVSSSATTKLTAVDVASKQGVKVNGAGTPVVVDCSPLVTKAGAGKALSSIKVGIRHVDQGTHGFEVALARAGQAVVAGSFQCNFRPAVVKGSFDCNLRPSTKGGGGAATIAPRFEGSATFSVKIVKAGAVVKTLTRQTGAITIPDFDGVHDGKEETLGVTLAYGLERAGSWTMKVEHEEYTLFFTAEASQKPLVGGGQLALATSGLQSITLVDSQVAVGDAPAPPPPPPSPTAK